MNLKYESACSGQTGTEKICGNYAKRGHPGVLVLLQKNYAENPVVLLLFTGLLLYNGPVEQVQSLYCWVLQS